ncbi:MAG TPA: hypothetical protein VFM37_17080 [Pseudonocardiaceae bacterium]|nr:hypothetical protein [Pseudonocardiaceae bacterium]
MARPAQTAAVQRVLVPAGTTAGRAGVVSFRFRDGSQVKNFELAPA